MDSDEERSDIDGDDNSDEEENNSASSSPGIDSPEYLIDTRQPNVLDVAAEMFGKGVYKNKKDRTEEGHRSCIPYRDSGCMFSHGEGGVAYYTDKSLTQDFLSKLPFDDLNMLDKTVSTSKIFSIISNSR